MSRCFLCKIAVDDILSFEQTPDQYNQEYRQCTATARFEICNQDSTRYYYSIIISYICQELLSLFSNFYLSLNSRCKETCVNSAHQKGYSVFSGCGNSNEHRHTQYDPFLQKLGFQKGAMRITPWLQIFINETLYSWFS